MRYLFFSVYMCALLMLPFHGQASKYPGIEDPELEARLEKIISPDEFQNRVAEIQQKMNELNREIETLKTPQDRALAVRPFMDARVAAKELRENDRSLYVKGTSDLANQIRIRFHNTNRLIMRYFADYSKTITSYKEEKGLTKNGMPVPQSEEEAATATN